MKKPNTNIIYQPKFDSMRTINQYPFKLKEKFKLFGDKKSSNYNTIKDKNFHNKFSFKINKQKLKFNKTTLNYTEKPTLPKVKILKFKKNVKIEPKAKQVKGVNINFNQTLKNIRCSSQVSIQKVFLSKNNNSKFNKELNNEDAKELKITNINDFMDKINKEYNDIGKIIKISFVLDKDRKYDYEKNEHVILKIIENDLRDNYGLDIKEFIFNEKKLNLFKSLKENNIENNSIINIAL